MNSITKITLSCITLLNFVEEREMRYVTLEEQKKDTVILPVLQT